MKRKILFWSLHIAVLVTVLLLLLCGLFPSHTEANNEICEISDTRPTVIIDGCDTGVNNVADELNCTISDKITQCACNAINHGSFVSCISDLTNDLKKNKIITGKEKGKIESCAAKAEDVRVCSREHEGVIAAPEDPFRFHFETAADELSIALKQVYTAFTVTPSPDINMNELESRKQEGIRHLREHPTEAADMLLAEASRLGQYDSFRFIVIFHLLGSFESERGIQFLSDRLRSPLPNCSDGEGELCTHVMIMKLSALNALGRISASGSALARSKIRDMVSSEQMLIQREAIRLFYENGGLSRWRSKQELSKQLPVSKHYLLHEIY
jgi:hypothetical protein